MESSCCFPPESLLLSSVVPDELIFDILSRLPVKSLLRFLCVSESWNSLITYPNFTKLHLHRSPKHSNVLITYSHATTTGEEGLFAVPCPVRSLIDYPASAVFHHHADSKPLTDYHVVDSCNGLVFLCHGDFVEQQYRFLIWNPATRAVSQTLPPPLRFSIGEIPRFGFGYDESTGTYKVAVIIESLTEHKITFKLYTLGDYDRGSKEDDCWRQILTLLSPDFSLTMLQFIDEGKFVNGSFNWLGYHHNQQICLPLTMDRLRIVSLDLRTATYKTLLLPRDLGRTPLPLDCVKRIAVLRGSLCFFCNLGKTEFVLWEMNEFGVEKSWIQLVKIRIDGGLYFPLFVSENRDIVMLTNHSEGEAIMCHTRENTVQRHTQILEYVDAKDYVQSLVLPY